MDNLQVVDVDSDREDLAVGAVEAEDVRVGVVKSSEALLGQPVEEHVLQTTAGLLDAVDWLLDLSQIRPALRVVLGGEASWGGVQKHRVEDLKI